MYAEIIAAVLICCGEGGLPAGHQGRADLPCDGDSRGQAHCHLLRGKEGFLHVR